MKRIIENIRESEIEDALVANLDIFKLMLNINKEVRLITRQLRLVDGRKRLDILLAVGDKIFLIELKADSFQREHIKQILTYKEELKKLQQEKNLIGGEIIPVLLVTNFKKQDLKICEENGIRLYQYSPIDILTKYYDKVASIAKFMKIRPVDLGVFNIGLINRVMKGLENGFTTVKEIADFCHLSIRSVTHHLKFSIELGLITQRKNRYYLTDLGLNYLSLGDESLTRDELSEEQAMLLREHIAKDPFSSPIVFGIYTIVESAFFLARNNYPVDFEELKSFFS
jgi:DNA-binding transcriptional ArsR family regulator